MAAKIRVLIVEDNHLVRFGVASMLEEFQDEMTIVAEADNGADAVRLAMELKPDIVLMDIGLPIKDGLQATAELKQSCPNVHIMALTAREDDEGVQSMLAAGAEAYCLKQISAEQLALAIKSVYGGAGWLDPAIVSRVFKASALAAAAAAAASSKPHQNADNNTASTPPSQPEKAAPEAAAASSNFGKYQIICEVGRGGMGIVYKGHDTSLKRPVAIKQLFLENIEPDKRDEFRERFRREACLAAGVTHPNLTAVYDVSISSENSYFVMEFLDGQNLRNLIEQSPGNKIKAEDLLPIIKQVCAGLQHAHDMSLVHRDIKPDNIFILTDGKVKITDFGIAKSIREGENSMLTNPGTMLGTMTYSSPEQLKDARHVDHRSDIYSLAVVAYEALCGQVPFAGDIATTLIAIATKVPRSANEINPELSPDVANVIAKAMRKRPEDRQQSASEFEKEFERAMIQPRGPAAGSMVRATGFPGIPITGPVVGAGGAASSADLNPSPVGKHWFSGRTSEHNKPAAGEPQSVISQPAALVKFIGQIGRAGDGPGAFQEPAAICVHGGKVVVADTSRRDFQVFGRDGRVQAESRPNPIGRAGSKTNGGIFSKPSSVAIDTHGLIYVSDSSDQYIRIFDEQGVFMREVLNKHGKDGGILGLLCDSAGNLYLSDPDNGCVHVMSIEPGTWLLKIGSKGVAEGQMQLPQGLALDRLGQLFVVDYGISKVSVFSKFGFYQRSWGRKGAGKGEFNVPRGIAIDKLDRVYIADSLNHRVQVFSTEGEHLYTFGGRGSEAERFIGPSDLSIDPVDNRLYVADKGNCRVQVFELL